MQLPIPDDTNPEFCEYLVCLPKNRDWLAIFRGLLDQISKGRFWDASTGVVTDAQAVGKALRDYNLHLESKEVILACTSESQFANLITELQNIDATLQQLDVNVSQQVSLQTESNQIAVAQASATAFSEATAYLNTSIFTWLPVETPEMPEGVSETVPPRANSDTAKGLKPVLIPKDDVNPSGTANIACQVAHDIVLAMTALVEAMLWSHELPNNIPGHPLWWLNVVHSAVSSVDEQNPDLPFLMPRPAILAISGALAAIAAQGFVSDVLSNVHNSLQGDLDNWRQELYCIRSQGLSAVEGTVQLDFFIRNQANTWGDATTEDAMISIFRLLFGLSTIGVLFYEAIGYTQPASNAQTCTSCGE